MNIAHRDGTVMSFNLSAISKAISKACLRQRERELRKQKESYTLRLSCTSDALLNYILEEEFYRRLIEDKIEQDRVDVELQVIKQIHDIKNQDDGGRIKNLMLAKMRGMSRSTAMQFATDLSLVTMPTPPTVETAIGSLSCGRITYASV